MEKVKFVKEIRITREEKAPELLYVKAKGLTPLQNLLQPALVSSTDPAKPTKDGIFEFDFVLGKDNKELMDVELEVDVVFRFNNLPEWVKGIKVNAKDNSDIELI